MRDLSEYKILGNYLVNLYDKYGVDSIRYETAKVITSSVLNGIKNAKANYNITQIDQKFDIVKNMISRGVFRTNPNNRTVPFKQVYNYEISRGISAVYSCDKSLVFKIQSITHENKDRQLKLLHDVYCADVGLEVQNAINAMIQAYKPQPSKVRVK
ncbi:MAG: hypothetical protein J6T74_09875 [Clostridia bacterium]|nr:hypothetical protein [Clostridia bacterium]